MADDPFGDRPYVKWAEQLVAAVDRRSVYCLAFLSAAYWLSAGLTAARKALWHDEIFTFSIAALPESTDVLRALWTGADNHPPLDYLIRHFFMGLFGTSEFVFRFPSLFAFWTAIICLFLFIRRRTSPSAGIIGVLFLLSTPTYRYGYEGRPYAGMIACAAASLLFWQLANEGKRLAVFGLALSLSVALYTHYYAVLLWVPLVLAEGVRTFQNRRIDWRMWLALAAAAVTIIPLLPLIDMARQFASGFWTTVDRFALLQCYDNLLRPAPLLLLTVTAVLIFMPDHKQPAVLLANNNPTWQELSAGLGYLALPAVCYILAKYITGAFLERYVLTTVLGIAIVIAFAAHRLQGTRVLATPAFLACLLLLTGLRWSQAETGPATGAVQQSVKALHQWMSNGDEPVVVGDALLFVELAHYTRPEDKGRLYYVASTRESLRLQGFDTLDRGVLGLQRLLASPVWEYDQFVRAFPNFRMVLPVRGWQKEKLLQDGATFTQIGTFQGQPVYRVVYPTAPGR
jgi:uncharacterized membrane protein